MSSPSNQVNFFAINFSSNYTLDGKGKQIPNLMVIISRGHHFFHMSISFPYNIKNRDTTKSLPLFLKKKQCRDVSILAKFFNFCLKKDFSQSHVKGQLCGHFKRIRVSAHPRHNIPSSASTISSKTVDLLKINNRTEQQAAYVSHH